MTNNICPKCETEMMSNAEIRNNYHCNVCGDYYCFPDNDYEAIEIISMIVNAIREV